MLVKSWFERVSDLLVRGVGLVCVTGDQFKPSTIKSAATVATGAVCVCGGGGVPVLCRRPSSGPLLNRSFAFPHRRHLPERPS